VNPKLRLRQELSKEFVVELSDVRYGLDSDGIRGMRLCLFAVVAGFFWPTDVVVAVYQSQELQHDERLGLGRANLSGAGSSGREFAGDGMQIGLCEGDRAARAGACVDAFLVFDSRRESGSKR
jgi:hypothetical protein